MDNSIKKRPRGAGNGKWEQSCGFFRGVGAGVVEFEIKGHVKTKCFWNGDG